MPLIHRNVAACTAITESASTMGQRDCVVLERAVAAMRIDTGGKTMDNLSFGLTMTIVGVGGTFLTLWILSLVVDLLKKVFPLRAQDEADKKA